MTNVSLFLFTQENCPPCYRLKKFIQTLPSEQQDAIEVLNFKTATGSRTALAEELDIEFTPTLVVANEQLVCELPDDNDYEDCDITTDAIETVVGGQNITTALPGIIDNYILSTDA